MLRLIYADMEKEALRELETYVAGNTLPQCGVLLTSLNSYLTSSAFCDYPVLHIYAGMLCISLSKDEEDEQSAFSRRWAWRCTAC